MSMIRQAAGPASFLAAPSLMSNWHLCRVPRLLPAGHPEAAASIFGAGTDTKIGAGKDGGDPNGRCVSADHRRPCRHSVALHRTGGGSGHPAPKVEDELARTAASQGHRSRRFEIAMTVRAVVPT